MAEVRDPGGVARLRELAESGPEASLKDARLAATRIATLLACKGGIISDITVGDCVELADTQRLVHSRGGQKKVDFYLRLHALGIFPADAPATIRAFGQAQGQLTIEELIDRYRLQCKPVRDLIVDYMRERQPALDYASLDAISSSLAGRFWVLSGAGESDVGGGFRALWVPTDLGVCWAGCAVGRRRHRADEGIRKALPVSLGRVRPGGPCRARRRCVHGRDRRCPSRGMAHRR
jgi:hypothetical protein